MNRRPPPFHSTDTSASEPQNATAERQAAISAVLMWVINTARHPRSRVSVVDPRSSPVTMLCMLVGKMGAWEPIPRAWERSYRHSVCIHDLIQAAHQVTKSTCKFLAWWERNHDLGTRVCSSAGKPVWPLPWRKALSLLCSGRGHWASWCAMQDWKWKFRSSNVPNVKAL